MRLFYEQPKYAQCHLPVGVIGQGTAQALPAHVNCRFIGEGTTEEAAKTFAQNLPDGLVGIVGGRSGRRTLQKQLSPQQYRDVVIYETLQNGFPITANAYVFTSPSNYLAFRAVNENPSTEGALVVAMGHSTARTIHEIDGYNPRMPENYSARALWNTILSAQ